MSNFTEEPLVKCKIIDSVNVVGELQKMLLDIIIHLF